MSSQGSQLTAFERSNEQGTTFRLEYNPDPPIGSDPKGTLTITGRDGFSRCYTVCTPYPEEQRIQAIARAFLDLSPMALTFLPPPSALYWMLGRSARGTYRPHAEEVYPGFDDLKNMVRDALSREESAKYEQERAAIPDYRKPWIERKFNSFP